MDRRHLRDGAGFSERSYKKLQELARIAHSQLSAWTITHPGAHSWLIDMTAGDGQGIQKQQRALFGDDLADATPIMLAKLCRRPDAERLIVCEKSGERRHVLRERVLKLVPDTVVLRRNQDLLSYDFGDCDYALIVLDPCGHGSYEEHLKIIQHIRAQAIKTDAILTFNQRSWSRHMGLHLQGEHDNRRIAASRRAKQLYTWMPELNEWVSRLPGRYLARSRLTAQSAAFWFQFIVATDYLADRIRRQKGWEIFDRANPNRPGTATAAASALAG